LFGDFGRNASRAIQIPEKWKSVLLDAEESLKDMPCILVAGLGSRLAEAVIKATLGKIAYYILVKPFQFEGKDEISTRCLKMIPDDRKYAVDNQKVSDENPTRSIVDFQKRVFGFIEVKLYEIESKLK